PLPPITTIFIACSPAGRAGFVAATVVDAGEDVREQEPRPCEGLGIFMDLCWLLVQGVGSAFKPSGWGTECGSSSAPACSTWTGGSPPVEERRFPRGRRSLPSWSTC